MRHATCCRKLSTCRKGTSLFIVTYDITENRPMLFFYNGNAEPGKAYGFGGIRRTLLQLTPPASVCSYHLHPLRATAPPPILSFP